MKTYLKQSANIILISILLSSIRYCIISEDYDLIKKKKVADGIINNENINLSYLNDFIDNVNQPTIINFSIAKQIYNMLILGGQDPIGSFFYCLHRIFEGPLNPLDPILGKE